MRKTISSPWYIVRYDGLYDPTVTFDKINRMVKIKIINKVYGGPTLFVFYFRHLKLKLTVRDQIDYITKLEGPKCKNF